MSDVENPSAFPLQVSNGPEMHEPSYGMTLRDWFAGQFLVAQGLWCPGNDLDWTDHSDIQSRRAAYAYAQADALLLARALPNPRGGE